jgi:hypothetical protein
LVYIEQDIAQWLSASVLGTVGWVFESPFLDKEVLYNIFYGYCIFLVVDVVAIITITVLDATGVYMGW